MIRTRDRDEAEEGVRRLFVPNRIDLLDGALDVRLEGTRVGSATIARLSYGADIRLTTADAAEYHFNLPINGRAVSQVAKGPTTVAALGEGTAYVPGRPADILWLEGCTQLCLMIPRATLEAELEQLIGKTVRPPIALEAAMDLSSPMAWGWRHALDVVLGEFENGPGLASHPVAGRQLERLIVDGLLLGHRHNYSDVLLDARPSATSRAVQRARRLLEEQPAHPWSTVTLANRVHVSIRALQHAFAADVGVPPMTYLRQVRLRLAHEALSRSTPGSTTVAAVAASLGITHLGRFAASYRQLFGETPSTTLRQS